MRINGYLPLFVVMTLFALGACIEPAEPPAAAYEPGVVTFDSTLAAELRADDYGMAQYVIAFLKTGPNTDQDSLALAELQRAHLDNIRRLAEEGKLVLAGPFMDDGDLRGIYVFDVASVEEAEALTATDPAIQQGALEMELHPWYGSAAVRRINDIHIRISRANP